MQSSLGVVKAITISQPFASMIASGEKWIENRSLPTNYRGMLAIHAGKGTQYMTRREMIDGHIPCGQVIATCFLVECVRLSQIIEKNRDMKLRHELIGDSARAWWMAAEHQHAEGPWCWILDGVARLEPPHDAVGKQGLWDWEANAS